MARSSKDDAIEKFRFSITVISVDLSLTGGVDALAAFASAAPLGAGGGKEAQRSIGKALSVVSRAGFSEVSLPKVELNEMLYRENGDSARFLKTPGLAKYTPVSLRRGVTDSRDLYNWYRLVNDDMFLQSTAIELGSKNIKPPVASENFRKEVIINVHDRTGKAVKQWILFNAWPMAYQGGNDLNASSDSEKLIEELTLNYEYFLELEGGVDGFAKEVLRDGVETAALKLTELSAPKLF